MVLPALLVEAVEVVFGGMIALEKVSLDAEAGSVTGLIGPNGAGKTTLFNVITGLQEAARGRVLLEGRDVTTWPVHRRARVGLARTFQRLEVFGSLTARENVLVAAEVRRGWARDDSDPQAVADEVLDRLGLRGAAGEPVDKMPTGTARLVELARALATRPKVLLLDEVGSGLDETETASLGDLLVELALDGIAVVLVEHDVDLVMRTCSRIFVLDSGRVIASGPPEQVRAHPRVQLAYLGAPEGAA